MNKYINMLYIVMDKDEAQQLCDVVKTQQTKSVFLSELYQNLNIFTGNVDNRFVEDHLLNDAFQRENDINGINKNINFNEEDTALNTYEQVEADEDKKNKIEEIIRKHIKINENDERFGMIEYGDIPQLVEEIVHLL